MKQTFLDYTCTRETEKAILVEDGGGEETWIPKSQIDDDSEVYKMGTEGDLVISEFFAGKLGWL